MGWGHQSRARRSTGVRGNLLQPVELGETMNVTSLVDWRAPIFLPGESQGQRSLVGHSSRVCKNSDTTEAA